MAENEEQPLEVLQGVFRIILLNRDWRSIGSHTPSITLLRHRKS